MLLSRTGDDTDGYTGGPSMRFVLPLLLLSLPLTGQEPPPEGGSAAPALADLLLLATWSRGYPNAERAWRDQLAEMAEAVRGKTANLGPGRVLEAAIAAILLERRRFDVAPPSTRLETILAPAILKRGEGEALPAGLVVAAILEEAGVAFESRVYPGGLLLISPDGTAFRAETGGRADPEAIARELGYVEAPRRDASGYFRPASMETLAGWYRLCIAERQAERGEWREASAAAGAALASLGAAPRARLCLGELFVEAGRFDEADPHLKAAFADPVSRPRAALALARAAWARGSPDLAQHFLTCALEAPAPQRALALAWGGAFLRGRGDAAMGQALEGMASLPACARPRALLAAEQACSISGREALEAIPPPEIVRATSPDRPKDDEATRLLLDLSSPDPVLRDAAASELRTRLADLTSQLREACADARPAVRIAAIGCLADAARGDPGALAAILARLEDDAPPVVQAAVQAASRAGSPEAIPALRRLHDGAGTDALRTSTAYALAELGSREIGPYLEGELSAESPRRRWNAARLLGRLGDAAHAGALANALTDEHPTVRLHAAQSLGALRTRDALPQLVALLADPERDVRLAAAASLERITGESHGVDREAWQRWLDSQSPAERVY